MKKLVLIDDETDEQTTLVEDQEINDLYCVLEDAEFYYNECMNNKYRNECDDALTKVKDKLEELLFASNDLDD